MTELLVFSLAVIVLPLSILAFWAIGLLVYVAKYTGRQTLWPGLRFIAALFLLFTISFTFHSATETDGYSPGAVGAAALKAAYLGLRLWLVFLASQLFTATTAPQQLVDAINGNRLLPLKYRDRLALLIGTLFRLLPDFSRSAGQISLALEARNIGKKPLRRLYFFCVPLLTQIILNTGRLAEALEARNFGGRRTPVKTTATRKDAIFFSLFIVSAALIACLSMSFGR